MLPANDPECFARDARVMDELNAAFIAAVPLRAPAIHLYYCEGRVTLHHLLHRACVGAHDHCPIVIAATPMRAALGTGADPARTSILKKWLTPENERAELLRHTIGLGDRGRGRSRQPSVLTHL